MPDLDAAPGAAALFGDLRPAILVMGFVGRGIGRADVVEEVVEADRVIGSKVGPAPVHVVERGVVEDLAFARRGKHDELVAEVAADRTRGRFHRNRANSHAREGAKIRQKLGVIAEPSAGLVEVEAVGVLHQEFAAAHHSEPRSHLVPEFPLYVVKHARKVAVALELVADDRGEHFLIGRPVEHLAVVAVADTQHFRPIGIVSTALAP